MLCSGQVCPRNGLPEFHRLCILACTHGARTCKQQLLDHHCCLLEAISNRLPMPWGRETPRFQQRELTEDATGNNVWLQAEAETDCIQPDDSRSETSVRTAKTTLSQRWTKAKSKKRPVSVDPEGWYVVINNEREYLQFPSTFYASNHNLMNYNQIFQLAMCQCKTHICVSNKKKYFYLLF